jgi:hypothetical protein
MPEYPPSRGVELSLAVVCDAQALLVRAGAALERSNLKEAVECYEAAIRCSEKLGMPSLGRAME